MISIVDKIYIIFNLSHDSDDFYDGGVIEYITTNLEDAINRMRELNDFCISEMKNQDWIYHYTLRGFNIPYDRLTSGEGEFFTECKNYIDED